MKWPFKYYHYSLSKEGVNGGDDDDNYDNKAQIVLPVCQTLLNFSYELTLDLC